MTEKTKRIIATVAAKQGISPEEVENEMMEAIHLYKKFGFKKVETHPSFLKIDNEEFAFDYMRLKIQ